MIPVQFNVVLVEPEIPQNTGSTGRLCLATGSTLHLVEPMGFEITHSRLKRAGLDYWEHLKVIRHASLEVFLTSVPKNSQKIFFTTKAGREYHEVQYQSGAYLIFGRETAGLPDWLVNANTADCARIPIFDARVRSLNLATAVGIGLYEAVRQTRGVQG